MGSSSKQVIGHKYFTNLLLFVGNPIEKMLGINFDKRGWLSPFIDEDGNALAQGTIDSSNLYGENEGGVAGTVYLKTGTNEQKVTPFYKEYMDSKELPASAFPFQSYLAFKDFYVGNSGYMKEMLLWPKRTRIRNDGREQWYITSAEREWVCEIGRDYISQGSIIESYVDYSKSLHMFHRRSINNGSVVNIEEYKNLSQQENFFRTEIINGIQGGSGAIGNYRMASIEIKKSDAISGLMYLDIIFTFAGINIIQNITKVPILRTVSDKTIRLPNGRHQRTLILIVDLSNTDVLVFSSSSNEEFIEESNIASIESSINIALRKYDRKWVASDESPDINPIHKIREILTDDTAMNKPESSVNNINFMKAADRIWDEGLGISWSITDKSCMDAINELCYHIESGIRVNRQTGLYEMVLFRDDWFEESEIHTISESKIKSMQYEITNADEVINQVNVNFYDRANIKNSSFSISESGLIQTLGRVNAETLDFPYFMNMRNSEIVANWKLKQLSTGAFKGSFTTGWREARKWNRYDLIRLPWSKRWTGTILVRIMNINLGGPTNNEVTIEYIEVVSATGMMNTTIVIDEPIDKPLPPQACQYEPFELPYYLAVMALGQRQVDDELAYEGSFGLVGAVAEQPQSNSLYAIMMTHNGIEGEEWLRAASIHYSETADFDQIISKTSTSFTVNNWKKITNVSTGTLIKCGRDWLGTPGEWMVFQGVDPYTGIISVKRGALDTPPQEWGPGSKLYFCGNDVAFDETEYVSGEEILVSALTTTPSGVLEQGGSIPIEMKARAIRPYPPANVKFNGAYWPETHTITNNIVLTWAYRNRVQQTGGAIIGWYEGDVTTENGVTYSYELTSSNIVLASANSITSNTTTINASILIPNKPHTLKLWSVRDGHNSYQKFEHSFYVESASLILTATATKSNVTGNTVPTANISVNVDEALKANIKFDGSSVSGKAPAGSIITIEVKE